MAGHFKCYSVAIARTLEYGGFNLKICLIKVGLALAGVAICQGIWSQTPPQTSRIPLDRKIELAVRSQFDVPGNCEIKIGPRTSSTFPGFDNIWVTISQGNKNTEVDFLISTDSKTLARLNKYDLESIPALSIDIQGRPVRGNPAAPVTVVNFDDLECPACAYMHEQMFPAALKRYGDEVRFIYKDNPLVELHPWALHAAVNATCLADQSGTAYWSYVDYVHTHGQEVSGDTRDLDRSFSTLDRIAANQAEKASLDSSRLQACLKKQDQAPVIQSMKQAERLGLNFTPALFVNGEEVRGFTTLDDLWKVIDRSLRQSGIDPAKAETGQPKQ